MYMYMYENFFSSSVFASVGGVSVLGVSHDKRDTLMMTSGGDLKGASLLNFELYLNPLEDPEKDVVVRANIQPLMIIYDEVRERGEGGREGGKEGREGGRERREGGREGGEGRGGKEREITEFPVWMYMYFLFI